MLELRTVGELMGPSCQLWPMDVLMLSVPPIDKLWQELQEIKPDFDRRGSKKRFFPSSTKAGFLILAASMGWIGSLLFSAFARLVAVIDAAATTARKIRFLNMVLFLF